MNQEFETYTQSLYTNLADLDQQAMTSVFREVFNAEADSEGFTRGSKSFIVTGPMAKVDCTAAFACLMRGQYSTAMLSVKTITRRLDSKWIPRWTVEDDGTVANAETMILPDVFDEDTIARLTPSELGDLVWFLQDSIANGVVLIIPMQNHEADLNLLGEEFGQFMEEHFEVVHGPSPDTQSQKSRRNSKHGGDETTSKRPRKHKRKNPT